MRIFLLASGGKHFGRTIIILFWILGIVLLVSACHPIVKPLRLSGPSPISSLSSASITEVSLSAVKTHIPLDMYGSVEFKREDVKDFPELMKRLRVSVNQDTRERNLKQAIRRLLENENPGLPACIDRYNTKNPCKDTENDLLNAFNALILSDSKLLYDRVREGMSSVNIPQIEGNSGGIRQSSETAFYLCLHKPMGGGSQLRTKRDRQRFNRVLLEDLYRRAFRKSSNLSFLLRFLDDDIPADCADRVRSLSKSFLSCPPKKPSPRVVLRPGDWVEFTYATGFQRVADQSKNKGLMLPPFSTIGFPVRYLPHDIPQALIGNEIQFLDLYIRSQMGTHTERAKVDKMPALEINAKKAPGELGEALDDAAPTVWNTLINPADGQLSLNLPIPGEQPSLSARLLRVLLNDASMPPAEKWITQKSRPPYDNAFEDLHVPFLGACPQGTPHSNFFGSINHSKQQQRLDTAWIQWKQQRISGAFAGHVMQVQVTRNLVDWSRNLSGQRPWSLSEWEASNILGYVEGKFQALYFQRETLPEPCPTPIHSKPTKFCGELPKGKLRINIAWPDSPYKANVGLHRFAPKKPAYLVPLLPKAENEAFVLSYKDLKYFSRPAWVSDTDSITKYLADVPISVKIPKLSRQVSFVDDNEIQRDRQIYVKWDDLNGFKVCKEVTEEDTAKSRCAPVKEVNWFYRLFNQYEVSKNNSLEAIAAYATSLDAWYRYRLASPEVQNEIKRLVISDNRSIDVTDDPLEANYRVSLIEDNMNSAVELQHGKYKSAKDKKWEFTPESPGNENSIVIHRHDLNKLTAFHIKKVYGLTKKPLEGFAGDDR